MLKDITPKVFSQSDWDHTNWDMEQRESASEVLNNYFDRVQEGVYLSELNPGVGMTEEELFRMDVYGVADNADQVLAAHPEFAADEGNEYALFLTPMVKSEQHPSGGWRWHKWGEYIGTQDPQREYLYDEPVIEKVFVYSFYSIGSCAHKFENWGDRGPVCSHCFKAEDSV